MFLHRSLKSYRTLSIPFLVNRIDSRPSWHQNVFLGQLLNANYILRKRTLRIVSFTGWTAPYPTFLGNGDTLVASCRLLQHSVFKGLKKSHAIYPVVPLKRTLKWHCKTVNLTENMRSLINGRQPWTNVGNQCLLTPKSLQLNANDLHPRSLKGDLSVYPWFWWIYSVLLKNGH